MIVRMYIPVEPIYQYIYVYSIPYLTVELYEVTHLTTVPYPYSIIN